MWQRAFVHYGWLFTRDTYVYVTQGVAKQTFWMIDDNKYKYTLSFTDVTGKDHQNYIVWVELIKI